MSRPAIVVDPLSTGQEYPAAFRAAGVATVAVLSPDQPNAALRPSWHPENFAAVHAGGDDLPALAAKLRRHDPLCLVAGSEVGVERYDALVEDVLPGTGNVPALAWARRDKWGMARALAAAGVEHLRQHCSADPADIASWLAGAGLADRPIVVKPPKSGSTDNVHLVLPGQDWRPFFDLVLGRRNLTGGRNEAVLVQEYAAGTEFLVDSYSVDGRHGLVDVCRYAKSRRGDRIGIYDRVQFLPPDSPEVSVVWEYARRVLDAVGIRNGCAHTEVMLTAAGPRLVETAARPAGGGHQGITLAATGDNQILRTVAHRVHGEFRPGYRLLRELSAVFLSAPQAGVWRNAEVFADVAELPTFHSANLPYATGDRVPATEDLTTPLGWVILAGPDPAAVETDFRRLKAAERRVDIRPDGAYTREAQTREAQTREAQTREGAVA